MSEDDVRHILGLAAGPPDGTAPGSGPDVAGLLAAGRAARRRRRTLALVAGVTAVAVVGGGTTFAVSWLGSGDGGTGAASSSASSSSVPSSSVPATGGSPSAATAAPPRGGPPVWPPPQWATPTTGPSNDFDAQTRALDRVMGIRAGSALTYLVDTLDPSRAHIVFQGYKRAASVATYEFYTFRADWRQGDGAGAVSVGFYAPGIPVGHHGGGTPAKLATIQAQCGEIPARAVDGSFRWTECTTETLPDGTTVRLGKGSDSEGIAITATHVRADGSAVTVSVDTGSYERGPDNSGVGKPLAELPLLQSQLRDVVVAPELVLAPAPG